MSLFAPVKTVTLSTEWQFTDVIVGNYYRVVSLSAPVDGNGMPIASTAAIAQADHEGTIYTQEAFTYQSEPQSFALEPPSVLEVRKIGMRLLPAQRPWQVRLDALDPLLISSGSNAVTPAQLSNYYTKAEVNALLSSYYTEVEVNALLALKQDLPPSRNESLSLLTYIATPAEDYPIFTAANGVQQSVQALNDGSLENGALKISGGTYGQYSIIASFDNGSATLNQIKIYPGQFNGPYNRPTSFRLFDVESDVPLTTEIPIPAYGWNEYSLLEEAALDAPIEAVKITFYKSNNEISVLEVELYGAA